VYRKMSGFHYWEFIAGLCHLDFKHLHIGLKLHLFYKSIANSSRKVLLSSCRVATLNGLYRDFSLNLRRTHRRAIPLFHATVGHVMNHFTFVYVGKVHIQS
jgi:hypothetical protein